ncbi:MAG: RNB domain-containing ribonuclease [Gemmatimonadaceae bacterium]
MYDLRSAAHDAMIAHGFAPDFPDKVQEEIRVLREPRFSATSTGTPRDLRHLLWSSIDNRNSRDLDQIEFAEQCDNSCIRLLIAIADVDALVAQGSATDDHAAGNTTSVYTGVAIFPMLPQRLSEDLTSLNEDEDRLAIVIEMDIAPDGSSARESIYSALVRNRAKLVYESVGDWLDGFAPAPDKMLNTPGLESQLRLQGEAAFRLKALRRRHGALDLETVEAQPVVVGGRVIDLKKTERNSARDIIENFMVAANTVMARHLAERGIPAIRRVVRTPRRWDRLVALAAEMSHLLPPVPDPAALAEFLAARKAADGANFADLSLSIVKLLGPGEYILERRMDSTRRTSGHFGLAVAEYVHSTAPNRRFVDLVTQRLAKAAESGTPPPYASEQLMLIAQQCTSHEDSARKVERLMRKKAAAVLMSERVGESFAAIVTGASPKGRYVRLLNPPVEGRLLRGGHNLDVGDTVRVRLAAADPERGYIDFETEAADSDILRKLERSRRKKAMATGLEDRIGETFEAQVTGVSSNGTYAKVLTEPVEGRVLRGHKGLAVGQKVQLKLIATDAVHGFIDFEHPAGVQPRKRKRSERKQSAARRLRDRIGEQFDAVVTSASPRATYVRTVADGVEGRLVRGTTGLVSKGTVRVILLATDAVRGFIDFARAE